MVRPCSWGPSTSTAQYGTAWTTLFTLHLLSGHHQAAVIVREGRAGNAEQFWDADNKDPGGHAHRVSVLGVIASDKLFVEFILFVCVSLQFQKECLVGDTLN